MNLTDLGLTAELTAYVEENNLSEFVIGRVIQENRERYIVSTGDSEYDAEITGNLRFSATSRADFPAVGDWVAMRVYDSDLAIIHKILPRKSVLERQAVGKYGEIQIISANIDVALIVQAINNNFSINRLERYMAICYSSRILPVLVLSKIDLSSEGEIQEAMHNLEKREGEVKYVLMSNITHDGIDQILSLIERGKTYCVVGSSGVGKSSLINNLLKKEVLRTGQISLSTNKGKHVTDRRELFVLENGGIIIDTPGMRELGVTDNPEGIRTTFQEIYDMSARCKYPDCRHINEAGCAVLEALNEKIIDKDSYDNYQKIIKDHERFQATVAEKRRKDKAFGKMIKTYHKNIRHKE